MIPRRHHGVLLNSFELCLNFLLLYSVEVYNVSFENYKRLQ